MKIILRQKQREKKQFQITKEREKDDEENDKDDSADKLKKVWKGITSSTTEDEVTKDSMVPYIKGKKVLFVHCWKQNSFATV